MGSMKRKVLLGTASVVILVAMTLVVRALLPSEEKEIRKTIDRIARLFEARDFDQLDGYVSSNYRGEFEGSKSDALKSARMMLANFENLRIDIRLAEVKVTAGTGRAVILSDISGVYFDPEMRQKIPFRNLLQQVPGRPEQVYIEFERSSGYWRVNFITWDIADRLAEFPQARKRLARKPTGR